jgi:hypothetical protein
VIMTGIRNPDIRIGELLSIRLCPNHPKPDKIRYANSRGGEKWKHKSIIR